MLVPRPQCDNIEGGGTIADPSVEEEIEIVLPMEGDADPEVVIEDTNTAVLSSAENDIYRPRPDQPSSPVQSHTIAEEPMSEGKIVEMTIMPDGTKTIKTTTTTRNQDGTTTTTITTSTVKGKSSATAVPDCFVDEDTGIAHV